MDATDVDRKDRARSWRTVAAGGAVAAVVAVTSSLGWWDGSGRTEERAPDVEVVGAAPAGAAPAGDEAPNPAASCTPGGAESVATGGDGGTPDPWAAGNEAARRWLDAHPQDAPGGG
jgi:hypothetical protein